MGKGAEVISHYSQGESRGGKGRTVKEHREYKLIKTTNPLEKILGRSKKKRRRVGDVAFVPFLGACLPLQLKLECKV